VPGKPLPSSAWRIAVTWPSIMADGAIMSAPAFAATTAWRPRFSIVWSLCTSPWAITPQWPCEVYSQKQVSEITTIPGAASLLRLIIRAIRPFGFHESLPSASLWCDTPNSISARTPAAAISFTAAASLRSGMRNTPGMLSTGAKSSSSSSTKIG